MIEKLNELYKINSTTTSNFILYKFKEMYDELDVLNTRIEIYDKYLIIFYKEFELNLYYGEIHLYKDREVLLFKYEYYEKEYKFLFDYIFHPISLGFEKKYIRPKLIIYNNDLKKLEIYIKLKKILEQ